MQSTFTPSVLYPFRFWVQKVLPAVYDDSLSYYELLAKVVKYLNDTMAEVNRQGEQVEWLTNAFNELYEYVTNYLDDAFEEELQQHIEDWFRENEPAIMSALDELRNDIGTWPYDESITELLGDLSGYPGSSTPTVADALDFLDDQAQWTQVRLGDIDTYTFPKVMKAIQIVNNNFYAEHFRTEISSRGNSVYTLKYTDNVATPGRYWPRMTVYNATSECVITGRGVAQQEISDGTIMFTLPTACNASSDQYILNCITWYENGNIHVGHLRLLRETYVLQFFGGAANESIPAGTLFSINATNFRVRDWGSNYAFPRNDQFFSAVYEGKTVIEHAIDWIHSKQGTLTYTNDRYTRFPYLDDTITGTDCSGLIACAFYFPILHIVNDHRFPLMPNLANIQAYFGEIIQVVKPKGVGWGGSDVHKLDLDKMEAGDIVSYCKPGEDYFHHSAIYDGNRLWHMNTRYYLDSEDTSVPATTLGPQPLTASRELDAGALIIHNMWGTEYNSPQNYAIVTRPKTHYGNATKNFPQNFALETQRLLIDWVSNYRTIPLD